MNSQIQAIDQQLKTLGVNNVNQFATSLHQIDMVKAQIAEIDKSNIPVYMSALQRLYTIQQSAITSNIEQVNTLLSQRIQLLESLTSSG